MKKYSIIKISGVRSGDYVDIKTWDEVEKIKIDTFPWKKSVFFPETTARLFYSDDCFRIRFDVDDGHIRAVVTEPNGPVCQDSCVEWFVNPCPEISDEYVNFEINPIGTLHAAIGKDRYERRFAEGALYESIKIISRIDSPNWSVEYAVPFEFFCKLYGDIRFMPGHVMKANFYKCGDLTRKPYWACWNPIGSEKPDFHLSKWFGELELI